jgi:hypothetical protein
MSDQSMMARVWITAARQAKFESWRASCLGFAANRRAKFYAEIREARKPKIEPGQLDLFA